MGVAVCVVGSRYEGGWRSETCGAEMLVGDLFGQ